ncbi:hypothetical protein N7462_001152 [Penicillium macrosclerotiorum]|uniref:uncharacterized protein n=1 Tax=Penicillium macrosclerotiorum TaxID=303699 RepID=UPI0025470AED|nr:uncharacterized protein N7462_001152 [Penicillium macrosclerotiorum]KAJ5699147.1 hypothetical protein N7462_001152 [Penicillium macrosclerotiorum]
MALSLISLPNDVLLMIAEQLDQHLDRWNIVFVCRHFHNLFISMVYRAVPLQNQRAANSFLHAISRRPYLARAVRHLDLSAWGTKEIAEEDRWELERSVLIRECIHSLSHSEGEATQWQESLTRGRSEAWSALLLPLLSHLEQLQVAHGSETTCLERSLERALKGDKSFRGGRALQHLAHVFLHHREDLNPSRNEHPAAERSAQSPSTLLLPFFQLPSMRTIIATAVVDSSLSNEEPALEPFDLSSIKNIDLRASSVNNGMEALITSCADLKSFKYQHSDSHLHSRGYQPTAFYRSLSHSKRTLEVLWLDHYGDHYAFTAAGLNQTHDEWFGSLAEFSALREVRIRLPNLLDIRYQSEPATSLLNCLPASLETIYIEGCEERHLAMLVSQLRIVVKSHRTRLPRLQRIDVEGDFHNASDESGEFRPPESDPANNNIIKQKILQAAEPLHLDCAAAGLELHLHDRVFTREIPT